MGEIRSTLDLVMEKTRNLSLSEEEKTRQKKADFTRRLQGLLQQYADGGDSVESAVKRMAALKAEFDLSNPELITREILGRIDPDRENDRWIDLLGTLVPEALAPLQIILEAHRKNRARLLRTAQKRLRENLFRSCGIEGSAVVPNPDKDPDYAEATGALTAETRSAIEAISAA